MAVVMGGAIAAAVVIIMDGGEVAAITTAGRVAGIAAGIKPHTRRGRLSRRPLSFLLTTKRQAADTTRGEA
jgi:hypothetical protein